MENLVKTSDRPMFIMAGKTIAGFVVFMDETGEVSDDECHTYIGGILVSDKLKLVRNLYE